MKWVHTQIHILYFNVTVHKLILWNTDYWKRSSGRPARIFIDQHIDVTGIGKEEMGRAMNGSLIVWFTLHPDLLIRSRDLFLVSV